MRKWFARLLRRIADALEPTRLEVARGDALTRLGINVGIHRELDDEYRRRLTDALKR